MKRTAKRIVTILALFALCLALALCAVACDGKVTPPDVEVQLPVKVSDGTNVEVAVGKSAKITVADYITANGNEVTANSDSANATVEVAQGLLTVTGVAEGEATVTVSCGEISVTFGVNVYTEYVVTVDGTDNYVKKGATFTLPAATTPADTNFVFDYWLVGDEHKNPDDEITVNGNVTVTSVAKRKSAVKLKDGEALTISLGNGKSITVAEYINAYGAEVTAASGNENIVTATIADGKVTLTSVAEGTANVTVTCGSVEITFAVTVPAEAKTTYTVTVEGEQVATIDEGGTYALPKAAEVADPDFEFVGWNVAQGDVVTVMQPDEQVTVNGNVTITMKLDRKAAEKAADGVTVNLSLEAEPTASVAIADYITTHGNAVSAQSGNDDIATVAISGGNLTITAIAAGDTNVTLACGSVTVTFTVKVTSAEYGTPAFKNGAIQFDLLNGSEGSYAFEITALQGSNFVYQYTVTPNEQVTVNGNALTYTATEACHVVLNVDVKATDATLGEKTTSFTVTVDVTDSRPVVKNSEIVVEGTKDLYDGKLTLNLAENIENANNVTSYKVNGADVDGTQYELAGQYTDEATEVVLTVTALYGNNGSVSYTYKANVMDSTAYRMPNGGFDLDEHGSGWSQVKGKFSDAAKYWDVYDYNNDGFFYEGTDGDTETITSPQFKVGNSGWITFKLGSMRPYDDNGVRNIYVEVWEKNDNGDVLIAKVGNVLFKDPERALKLNDYKLDLSAFKGKTVYVKAVDNEAGGDFRSLELDAFNTWWNSEPSDDYTDLSKPYALDVAVTLDLKNGSNVGTVTPEYYSQGLIAALSSLVGEVADNANGLTVSGPEFTATKCGTYSVAYKLGNQTLFNATITVVNTIELPAIANIEETYGYTEWFDGTNAKQVEIAMPTAGENMQYAFAITNVTGGASAEDFTMEGGLLKYTPAGVGTVAVTVETTVADARYTPSVELAGKVTFTVTLNFMDETISLKNGDEISEELDVNDASDKQKLVIDFANYINVPEGKTASYTAKLNGSAIALDASAYTVTFAGEGLTDVAKEYVFDVTATEGMTSLNYVVTYKITDTYQYRIVNGGFDNGLDGWTLSNNDLGGVNDAQTYWGANIPFNNDGNFFNAYYFNGEAKEWATGTLTSSPFVIGGSGWITYKLGAAKNADKVHIQIVEKDTGAILARYYNNAFSDNAENTQVRGCTLVAYMADLSLFKGKTVYILITDNAASDYGLFFVDSFVTYYAEAPDGLTSAVAAEHPETVYDIYNGGFESDMLGWSVSGGDIGAITSDSTYWNNPEKVYGKEGDKLFSWWSWNSEANVEVNREGNMGTLTSSMFMLKNNKYVSFMIGGGANRNVYVELVNADSGTVMAVFHNDKANEAILMRYHYQVTELDKDAWCYFRVVDVAISGWGCFAADGFKVNLDAAPADSTAAVNKLTDYKSVANGSFETGNLDNWTITGDLGAVVNTEIAEGWYQTNDARKDGSYLFTFYYFNGERNINAEGGTGVLRSSAFVLQKNGIISFRFGAAKNPNVFINVYTTGGRLLATFRNNAYNQDTDLVYYYYQFDNAEEVSCYFEVVDNATGDGYGCFVADDFRANLDAVPADAVQGSFLTQAERNATL